MKPLSPETAKVFAPVNIDAHHFCKLTLSNEKDKFTADFWSTSSYGPPDDHSKKYTPKSEALKLINRFPEKKRITTGFSPFAFELAATDYTIEILNDLWPRDQLWFHDEATELRFQEILLQSAQGERCAEVAANYKASKIVPAIDFEFSADDPLSPYQQIALFNAMHSPGFGLFMEQGTGKTPPTIAVICNGALQLKQKIAASEESPRMYYVLVVCPLSLRLNWEIEIQRFATQPGKITVLRGPDIGRVKQLFDATTIEPDCLYSIVICSYETMSRSWEALSKFEWDLAVLDEGHSIRSVTTARFKTAVKLRDRAQKRMILTGTPICNSPFDTYAQFEFIGKGYSGFNSFHEFKKFYGVYETTDTGFEALVRMNNLPFMQERLARYSFIISKAEALPDLPPKKYDTFEVEMTPTQAEYYNELRSKLAIEIEADLADDSQPRAMVINNILTKLLRLAQITSGFVTWSPMHSDDGELISARHIEYFSPNPKIEAIREIAATKGPDNKTIIWACWHPDIDYLESLMQTDGHDYVILTGKNTVQQRKEAEDRFNFDPACKWFIGNPAAGGQGLNLLGYDKLRPDDYTTNADHVIYYSQNWSPVARQQSEDRPNRRGTRVPTQITDLMVARTIDEEIRIQVLKKKLVAMDVSNLTEILNAVLYSASV